MWCRSLSGFFSALISLVSFEAVFGASSIRNCCMTVAMAASSRATTKAARTPSFSPHKPIQTPPRRGPSAIGIRRTRASMDTPIVRFSMGRTSVIRFMVAGREMALQDRKKTAPTITACQAGMSMTMQNPNMAAKLKNKRAFFVPNRSER